MLDDGRAHVDTRGYPCSIKLCIAVFVIAIFAAIATIVTIVLVHQSASPTPPTPAPLAPPTPTPLAPPIPAPLAHPTLTTFDNVKHVSATAAPGANNGHHSASFCILGGGIAGTNAASNVNKYTHDKPVPAGRDSWWYIIESSDRLGGRMKHHAMTADDGTEYVVESGANWGEGTFFGKKMIVCELTLSGILSRHVVSTENHFNRT